MKQRTTTSSSSRSRERTREFLRQSRERLRKGGLSQNLAGDSLLSAQCTGPPSACVTTTALQPPSSPTSVRSITTHADADVQIFTSPPRRVRRVKSICSAGELSGEVIRVESGDGACFVLPVEVAAHSLCLSAMLQRHRDSASVLAVRDVYAYSFREQDQGRVHFPTLSGKVLERVFQFCFHDHLVNGPDLQQSTALAPPASPASLSRVPSSPSSSSWSALSSSASAASSSASQQYRKRPATSFRSPSSRHQRREVRTEPRFRRCVFHDQDHRSSASAAAAASSSSSSSSSSSDESDENGMLLHHHTVQDDRRSNDDELEQDDEQDTTETLSRRLSSMECSELPDQCLFPAESESFLADPLFRRESLHLAGASQSQAHSAAERSLTHSTLVPSFAVVQHPGRQQSSSPRRLSTSLPLHSPPCWDFQNPLLIAESLDQQCDTTWCREFVKRTRHEVLDTTSAVVSRSLTSSSCSSLSSSSSSSSAAASSSSSATSSSSSSTSSSTSSSWSSFAPTQQSKVSAQVQLRQRRVFCFEIPPDEVMDILMAAHFLGISTLQERACQMVADNALAVSSFEGLPDEVVHQILARVTPRQLVSLEKLLSKSHPLIDTSIFWCAAFEQKRRLLGWELDECWYEFSWTYAMTQAFSDTRQYRSLRALIGPQREGLNEQSAPVAGHAPHSSAKNSLHPLTPSRSALAAAVTTSTTRVTSTWKHEYLQRDFQHRIDGMKLGTTPDGIRELHELVALYGEHLWCAALPNALVATLEACTMGLIPFLRPLRSLCFLDLSGARLSNECFASLLELVRDRTDGLRNLHSLRLSNVQPNDDRYLFRPLSQLLLHESALNTLDLSENQLTVSSMMVLCQVLESSKCTLRALSLAGNRLQSSPLETVVTYRRRRNAPKDAAPRVMHTSQRRARQPNPLGRLFVALERSDSPLALLDLGHNELHLDDIDPLQWEAFSRCVHLHSFVLQSNDLARGYGPANSSLSEFALQLVSHLPPSLQLLNLRNTNLGPLQVKHLCDGLIQTPTGSLAVLDLSNNRIGQEGVAIVAQLIATSETLQVLNISENHIREEGARTLASALLVNSALCKLVLSKNLLRESAQLVADAVLARCGCEEAVVNTNLLEEEFDRRSAVSFRLQALDLDCNEIPGEVFFRIRQGIRQTPVHLHLEMF